MGGVFVATFFPPGLAWGAMLNVILVGSLVLLSNASFKAKLGQGVVGDGITTLSLISREGDFAVVRCESPSEAASVGSLPVIRSGREGLASSLKPGRLKRLFVRALVPLWASS